MIRVSVYYAQGEGVTFDHDYYRDKHIPLAVEAWQPESHEIDRGVNGPHVAAVHFRFPSLDAFQQVMAKPETQQVLADVPNYTNADPVLQVSEIV